MPTFTEISTSLLLYNLVAEDQPNPVIVFFVSNIESPTERSMISILFFSPEVNPSVSVDAKGNGSS